MATKPDKIDAHAIRQAMLKRWAAPEYALLWEVGDATGARHSRFADAVIMSLWPSRGLELHGVEIKVSKSDWKREATDPRKAETIGAFCDRWWVHTAPGVIGDVSEVPPAWGWRVWDGAAWRTQREAEKTEAKPCNRAFLAALLRREEGQRSNQVEAAARRITEESQSRIEARVASEVESRTRRAKAATDKLDALESALGFRLDDWSLGSDVKTVGALVKIILRTGVASSYGGLSDLAGKIGKCATSLEEALRSAPLKDIEDELTASKLKVAA